jgi:hypothetical protein
MVETVSGGPLLRWVNHSTAKLVEKKTATGWHIYVDSAPGALGGGCVAPPDGAKLKALEELAQMELPAAEKWIDQHLNKSFPFPPIDFNNLTIPHYDCPVAAEGNITQDWFKVVTDIQNLVNDKYSHCLTRSVTALNTVAAPNINYPFLEVDTPSGELWYALHKHLLSNTSNVALVVTQVSQCDGPGTSPDVQGPVSIGLANDLQAIVPPKSLQIKVSLCC